MVLKEEWDYYHENCKSLSKWYPNSFLVIKGNFVYGGFPTIIEAYISALNKFEFGTFLVLKTTNYDQIIGGTKVLVESELVFDFRVSFELLLQ